MGRIDIIFDVPYNDAESCLVKMVSSKKTLQRNQYTSYYLTPEGLEQARAELGSIKTKKRAQVTERIQNARDAGGTEENSEYNAAMEEYTMLENRIDELEKVIRGAKVISIEARNSDIVTIGSTVTVEMDGEVDEFTIVGRVEANPAKKKISNESPVGIALLGTRVGEEIEVATSIVKYKCKVLEIR